MFMKLIMENLRSQELSEGGARRGSWSAEAGFPHEGFCGTFSGWAEALKARPASDGGLRGAPVRHPQDGRLQGKGDLERNLPLREESTDGGMFDLGAGAHVCVVGKGLPLFEN